MTFGLGVGNDAVELSDFEGGLIASIFYADHETRLTLLCSWFFHFSVQQRDFDLQFSSTDPMRFEPVNLGSMHGGVTEAYCCDALALPPTGHGVSNEIENVSGIGSGLFTR